MKKHIVFAALCACWSILIAKPTQAAAGPITSGGGNSVVCYDRSGAISSAELLDFYEARIERGERIPKHTEGDFSTYLEQALSRLSKTAYGIRTETKVYYPAALATMILSKRRFVSDPRQMPILNDVQATVSLPQRCRIRQTVAYLSEDDVLFDKQVWNALSPMDQAGLIVHEVIYWFERKLALAEDSRRARMSTANLFNPDFSIESVYTQNADQPYGLYCMSGKQIEGDPYFSSSEITSFVTYYENGDLIFHFFWLDGEPVMTKTVGRIPKSELSPAPAQYAVRLDPSFQETAYVTLTLPRWTGSETTSAQLAGYRQTSYRKRFMKSELTCWPTRF